MKQFIFLYPIPEIINAELQYKEKIKESYQIALNKCIDLRYRKQGFIINYAIFDDTSISSVIKLQKSDKIIKVGLDFKTHITKQPNGKYPSPNQNYILNQLGEIKIIRIGGFHKQDCVEKLAKRAYEKGIDTLVDEDLTEFLSEGLGIQNLI